MITFLAAVYNEQDEIDEMLGSVVRFVDKVSIADDGSTDRTLDKLAVWKDRFPHISYVSIEHTGLPETVKNRALQEVTEGSWVLMLDADERLDTDTLSEIVKWVNGIQANGIDYVYFRQWEIIDGRKVREFQKCKLFRKEVIHFPLNNIHADDQFDGEGIYQEDWVVYHRKSSTKQIVRETEYLSTYKKLLDEGSIDEGRYQWLVNLHHFVKPHG